MEIDPKPLERRFYARPADVVARELLGKVLRHGETSGVIVETEAYLGGDDLAAHAARGVTPRTRVIFGPPGHAYVYLIYGMYECLNITADLEGTPGCVLLRAIEPLTGTDLMHTRRSTAHKVEQLASGPGKLTLALGVTRELNGADVTSGPLTVHATRPATRFDIVTTPRIGIRHCADWPLRFYVGGNRFVSKAPKRSA